MGSDVNKHSSHKNSVVSKSSSSNQQPQALRNNSTFTFNNPLTNSPQQKLEEDKLPPINNKKLLKHKIPSIELFDEDNEKPTKILATSMS